MAGCVELEAVWGRYCLPFRLRRADVARLRIVVDPDGGIAVTAPLHATDEAVIARVSRRGGWIQQQRERFARWQPRTPVRQYLDGETHLFLGRQFRLHVRRQRVASGPSVSLAGDRLVVDTGPDGSRNRVRELVQTWYAMQAKAVFREQLDAQCRIWRRHGVEPPRLVVRPLRNRWGSMTPAGRLVLNSDLVRASPILIDYVISHELAHVLHPDHGSEWRSMLAQVMPDWQERKNRLEHELL